MNKSLGLAANWVLVGLSAMALAVALFLPWGGAPPNRSLIIGVPFPGLLAVVLFPSTFFYLLMPMILIMRRRSRPRSVRRILMLAWLGLVVSSVDRAIGGPFCGEACSGYAMYVLSHVCITFLALLDAQLPGTGETTADAT